MYEGGQEIIDALLELDRLRAQVTVAIAQFDSEQGYAVDGYLSMQAWLRFRARRSKAEASALVKTGRRFRQLPHLQDAAVNGQLCAGQVQAVVANLNDRTVERFADHEAAMVPVLTPLPVHETELVMRRWQQHATALDDPAPPRESRLSLNELMDGTWYLNGNLGTEAGVVLSTALRIATTKDVSGEPVRSPGQRRTDALTAICTHYLNTHDRRAGRHRPHVNVVVDYDTLMNGAAGRCETIDGSPLDPDWVRGLACHANIHRVIMHGSSTILDYGRATDSVSDTQYRALSIRDRTCRMPGCDRPNTVCDAHHIDHWTRDLGPTDLNNLALFCPRHHTLIHRRGWHLELDALGHITVKTPDGQTLTERAPP